MQPETCRKKKHYTSHDVSISQIFSLFEIKGKTTNKLNDFCLDRHPSVKTNRSSIGEIRTRLKKSKKNSDDSTGSNIIKKDERIRLDDGSSDSKEA
ncbi:hypothetical protein JTB14_003280 [Gonioctena quinquepunctata]|nr:hypothetical protein JTB14_003280 [Gonioctena quinquepunctata]